VVCTLTGHGLKDPDTAVRYFGDVVPVAPNLDAVLEQLGW
jgi:threonine synthase